MLLTDLGLEPILVKYNYYTDCDQPVRVKVIVLFVVFLLKTSSRNSHQYIETITVLYSYLAQYRICNSKKHGITTGLGIM